MSKLTEITELVSRIPDGGVVNSNDRWDMGYLEKLVHTYRARLLKAIYLSNKRINPVCYQKHWPEYEELLQDDDGCTVKFRHPEVISLDDRSDGFRYIGGTDCASNFARIHSRAWVSTFNDSRITNVNNRRRTSVLYDGSAQVLEIYGNPEVDSILTESLLATPTDIPTYNKDQDQYPLSEDLITDMISMIFNDNIATELRIPVGNNPIVNMAKPKKNIK